MSGTEAKGLTRRNFLKTSAIAAGTAVLGSSIGCSSIELGGIQGGVSAEDSIYSGFCVANCNGGCALNIKVREGKVVQTSMAPFPDPDYNRICLKGASSVQRIYGPKRLKYPLRRVGERGAGEWERITWDEAANEIAEKWTSIRAQYGPSANFFQTGAIRLGTLVTMVFAGLMGGSSGVACDDQAVDYVLPLCVGHSLMSSGSEPKDIKNAKTIIIWGNNPGNSNIQQCHFMFDAIDSGAKMYTIGPSFHNMAAKSDKYIYIKPGSDAVLAMAIAKYLIDEDLIDKEFLSRQSVAPFLVKDDGSYLRMSDLGVAPIEGPADPSTGMPTIIDSIIVYDNETQTHSVAEEASLPALTGPFEIAGIKVNTAFDLLKEAVSSYSLEKAQEICGVSAEDAMMIAHVLAGKDPVAITQLPGMDHYYNGHQAYFAIATLLIITGHLGKPGDGPYFATYKMGANANWAVLYAPSEYPPGPQIPLVCLNEAVEKKEFNNAPIDIKSLTIWGKEIMGGQMNRERLIETFNKMELVVVADLEMNDTARYADIVLPMAHFFETEDVVVTGTPHPYDIYQEKAVEPLFECLNDYDAAILLLDKMGLSLPYESKEDFLRAGMDSDLNKAAGNSFDVIKEKKIVNTIPAFMQDPEGLCVLGYGGVYSTDTGRAQFYIENPTPRVATGVSFDPAVERLPHWTPPFEAWDDTEAAKKYPLNMVQTHSKWRAHSTFAQVEWLRELNPEPAVYLSPEDAVNRSINNHDIVKVFNDRGFVVLKAIVDKGISVGMIDIPKGWHQTDFIAGHYNNLTNDVFHPFVVNNVFSDTKVEIELYEGE
jgi:molybdopterin-containing oxidoreductase family molybdopterin binding subunit